VDYVEYRVKTPEKVPEKAVRISNIILKREKLKLVKSRKRKDLLPYARQIFDVINAAYEPLFYFVELTEKQIDRFTKKYLSLIQPEYVVLVVDKKDKLVGFAINMPSLTEAFQKAKGRLYPFGFLHFLKAMRNPKVVDMYLIGILPEYQGKGVQAILIMDLTQMAIEKNVEYGESNSELEENLKVQNIWKNFDSRQNKRKRIYLKTF
jgi:GNAT superfamily N-acetyltransferase